jgi:hypothetical protein
MTSVAATDEDRDAPVNEAVRDAWKRATEAWDDKARHDALLGLVAQHNCFAWAAARYKERAGDPVADVQLERLRKSATAVMLATAATRKPAMSRYTTTVWVLLAILSIVIVGILAVNKLRQDRGSRPAPTRPAGR